MWRTASGLTIIAVLENLFNTQGISSATESIVKGAILVLARGLNTLSVRRASLTFRRTDPRGDSCFPI
jgi:ribose/xylose/arabinose/galactoside ABC-type transport system permease subunit